LIVSGGVVKNHFSVLTSVGVLALCAAGGSLAQAVVQPAATGSQPVDPPPAVSPPTATPDSSSTAQSSLQAVIVTAQRKSENLQSVPISVTALSQEQLTEKSVYSGIDLGKVVPGLTAVADAGYAGTTDFAIRGRGLSYGAATGSVETYFAEVPLSSPYNMPQLPPQFFDLQSIQVLKGPQGTLFGRNTTGGAVLLVPQAPTDQFEGYGRIQGGNFGDFQFEGALNLPLSGDRADLRFSVFEWQRSGYAHTTGGLPDDVTGRILPPQQYDNQDVLEGRMSLVVRPVDELESTTILTYHRDDNRSSDKSIIGNTALYGSAGLNTPPNNPYVSVTNVDLTRPANESGGLFNTTTYKFDYGITAKNVLGYITAQGLTEQGTDADGRAGLQVIDLLVPDHQLKNSQLTEEPQLQGYNFDDRLSWTVGGLLDRTWEPGFGDGINQYSDNYGVGATGATLSPIWEQVDIKSEAFYLSGTFKITQQLSVTAGYRHTWDQLVQNEASTTFTNLTPGLIGNILNANTASSITTLAAANHVPNGIYPTQVGEWQGNPWNLGLEYKITDDLMTYGGYRYGFKRGGFNASAPPSTPAFKPETVDDWYLGFKSTFQVGNVQAKFNIEGYYDFYHGNQVSSVILAPTDGCTALCEITENIPQTVYRGFDADLELIPTNWLRVTASYSYLDAFNQRWFGAAIPPEFPTPQNLTVNQVEFAPKNKITLTPRFHANLGGDWGDVAFAPTVSYQSTEFTSPYPTLLPYGFQVAFGNVDPAAAGGETIRGYTLLDLRVEWNNVKNSGFNLALNGTNLTNRIYETGDSGSYYYGFDAQTFGAPRMWSAEVSKKF
jgi:iron complex outermembrane recepter protein